VLLMTVCAFLFPTRTLG